MKTYKTPEKQRAASRAWFAANEDRARERQRLYREANREKLRARHRLRYATDTEYRLRMIARSKAAYRANPGVKNHVKRRALGYDATRFAALLARQGHKCASCGDSKPKKWCLDHDHNTQAVRGILCDPCNRGIGFLGDTATRVRAAAAYLEQHEQRQSLF